MIKVTTVDPYTTTLVPLSKILSIVDHEGRVHISVQDITQAVVIVESLDNIETQINQILDAKRNF